jgi:colanic acid biosynthesis glycosyl transferase WcaI
MTHVLYISAYYPPEKGVAAVCVSEFATRLVKRGYQVTVLTTVPNHPTGIVPPEYRGRLLQEEMRDGVRVVRTWSDTSPNTGFLRRVLAQLSFGCLAPLLGGKAVGRPDIILVESPPLFDAIAGRMLAWWKHCPLIFSVSDLWPEAAVQLGALRNRVFIRLAEWLEWTTYQQASLVWTVSEGFRNTLIQRGLSPEHIFLLTNGVDTAKFRPLPQAQARAELGWDERFTILYAGSLGLSHGLTTILDAAEQIRDRDDMHFVLVGEGGEKADLVTEAQRRNLTNVTFLDPIPHDQVPQLLAAADVSLAHARRVPSFKGMVPVKMFEAMACARPLLLAVDGDARQLAEQEAGAAIYIEPENPIALAAAILNLCEHPDLAEALGQRGRAYVEAKFDYDQLAAALDARIAALLGKQASISTSVTSVVVSTLTEKGE